MSVEAKITFSPTLTEQIQTEKAPTETDITIRGVVLAVEPPGNLIVLEEQTEGFKAIVLEDSGELALGDGSIMTMEEIRRGMSIQISGVGREDGVLVAYRILVSIDPSVTATPRPPQSSPAPPTPLSLSSISSEWSAYEFSEFGLRLSMPTDWGMLRMPGAYFFAPVSSTGLNGNQIDGTQLTISLKPYVPVELETMTEALIQEWQDLSPRSEFSTTSFIVDGVEGVAFWGLSEATCVDIYVPAYSNVHQISFLSTFCNEPRTQLNEVGQKIVDSIQFSAPTN